MPAELLALSQDAHDPDRLAAFWADLLQRTVRDDRGSPLLPGTDTQVGLRFTVGRTRRVGPNPIHLHLTSSTPDEQRQTVDRALALGARPLDVGQRPEEQHVVLADPEGNEFCVIEAGNAFLAGCGFLGELTCDGAPLVGRFWAQVLGWPLVWDQDEQTAVQSPRGGTKISWDGWSDGVPRSRGRQRFELECAGDSRGDDVAHLLDLGARRVTSETSAGIDRFEAPGGEEFALRATPSGGPASPARDA